MPAPLIEDTIVAPATGSESAAVAIVRLSGPHAHAIFARLFRPVSSRQSFPLAERKLVLGTAVTVRGEPLDEVLGVTMRAPHSFTGEDVAEFQCHGGSAVVRSILQACLEAGARLAHPGEFSKRAFFNQRLDLAQAEALADLIAARTDLERKVALRQLRGGLSQRIASLRQQLIETAAEIEAHLDFPEEEIAPLTSAHLSDALSSVSQQIDVALRQFERARIVREGARVVLAGEPNVGKSSLFNALVGRERAIVTPHPGTTRDTIESTLDLNGIALTLVDTAGMRESADEIERLGIARTEQEIRNSDVVVHVVDAAAPEAPSAPGLPRDSSPAHQIVVVNKADLLAQPELDERLLQLRQAHAHVVAVSTLTRAGLAQLEELLSQLLPGDASPEELELCSVRHAACLRAAHESLVHARQAFTDGLSGEFVMVDLREAILRLDEILGTRLDEEILDSIFSRFCLGK